MRRLLWRRSLVLVVVGFLHALLLYVGDILAAYGVLTISSEPPHISMLPPDVLTMVTSRPLVSLYVSFLGPLGFMCPFAIGLWAGRRRILEQPERHRTLLRVTASFGIGAAVLGAQPISLVLAGVLTAPDRTTLELLGPLHDATGILGGFGYAALLSLIAARLQTHHPRPVVDAIAAVGQRSMTCYLAQSVVWTVAFTPFLLDLCDTLTVVTTALLAVTTWLITVALADWMRRTGHRGPFEVLIRRVTYRPLKPATPDRDGPDSGSGFSPASLTVGARHIPWSHRRPPVRP